jgi:UDP-N-acetylglucosamine 4-epimerase
LVLAKTRTGPYAAVIPQWFRSLHQGEPAFIYGDGETSRDFCFVQNVVQANLLAASGNTKGAAVFNVACGERTTLNSLFAQIREQVAQVRPEIRQMEPVYSPFRLGDVRHSLASIEAISAAVGYRPTHSVAEGLLVTASWYRSAALAKR